MRDGFWREAAAWGGSVAPRVLPRVLAFGLLAAALTGAFWLIERAFDVRLSLDVTPHELSGVALGLLLVARTNAGYDRWWEARKLWGGFVDKTRNLAVAALGYGPADGVWRGRIVRWTAAYMYLARDQLRRLPPGPEVAALVGPEDAGRVEAADHLPVYAATRLAALIREARDRLGMDGFTFLRVDDERARLVECYGGCERIVNTPLPRVYAVKIRHFIALFLVTLPLALLHRLGGDWLVPVVTMLVAYPLLSLDQIGVELENPFATANLSHLPLDGLAGTIERNLMALLKAEGGRPAG